MNLDVYGGGFVTRMSCGEWLCGWCWCFVPVNTVGVVDRNECRACFVADVIPFVNDGSFKR